jgi:hypothetical protein
MIGRLLFGAVLVAVAAVVLQSLPDLAKYLEIREM